jgi:hypothetical protein
MQAAVKSANVILDNPVPPPDLAGAQEHEQRQWNDDVPPHFMLLHGFF